MPAAKVSATSSAQVIAPTSCTRREMTTETLPITALIATVRGWPTCREAISRIAPQVAAAGGEFIVADGSAAAQPPSNDELAALSGGRQIRWLSMPGSSVFQLRFAGYRAARGEIVAVTEDHVYVEPDW